MTKTKTRVILTLDYAHVPIPEEASEYARRLVQAIRLVPAPWWVSYKQLAEVLQGQLNGARGVASSLTSITPQQIAIAQPQTWLFNWMLVRDAKGNPVGRTDDMENGTRHLIESQWYEAMGGSHVDGEVCRAVQSLNLPTEELAQLVAEAGI